MRRSAKRLLRILALALVLCMALPGHTLAETIDEVQKRQEQLRQENEALEQKIESLRSDEAKALEYQQALEEKIALTEKKIDAARDSIQTLDREIGILEKKLSVSRQEYQSTLDLFSQRIRALYMAGDIGTLEILLSADSFSEFTMRTEMISAVTRHDQELVEKLEDYLRKTKEDREKAAALRQEEAGIKKGLEDSQQELEVLREENSELIASLEGQQAQARNVISANEEEDAELEEKLQDLIRQKNEEEERRKQQAAQGIPVTPATPGMHDGFSPRWPLPGVGLESITGHYGDMYDNGPHNGLDIGAAYGTPIVAAQAGQVLSAEFHYSWGNNVLIWHNDTFSTRYAHMSSIAVSPGEYVEQGDVIGYVGSTGYSFGNHLHFEVYYQQSRVDPDPYLGITR